MTTTIDRAALFLVDLMYINMFEEVYNKDNRRVGYRCKVCDEVLHGTHVEQTKLERHHAKHKKDKSQYVSEQIAARRERLDAMSADKRNVSALIEQFSVPAVYLRPDGKKFKPGGDAQFKSDLFHAQQGWEKPDAKHKFEGQEAARIIAGFGWNDLLTKAIRAREQKENRAKAKAANAAQKERDKAAAKTSKKKAAAKTTSSEQEAKPDPKPAKRASTGRSRIRS